MLTGLSALDLLSAAAFAHEEHRANPEHEHEYPLDPALEQQFAPFQNAQLPPLPSEPFEPYEHPSPPPPPPPPPPVGQQEQEQPDEDGDKTDDDDTLVGPRITFKRPRDDADDPDPGRQLALGAHVEPPSFFASSALPSLASLGTFPPSSLPPLPSLSSAFLPPLPDLAHFTVLPPIPTTTSPYHPAPPPPHAHPQSLPHWVPEDAGLIRCVCPYTSDDGFTIQCDMCNVWQHAGCVSISPEDVPDEYLCELCDPRGAHERGVDGQRAEESQRRRMEAELRRAGDGEMRRGASVGVGAQVRQHQEIIQQQLQQQQQQQQQQREHEHAVAVAAAVAHEQPAPRGKPRRSLTDDGLATPADASPVESLPATPAPAPPAPPRNARKRGSAKQAAPNGSSAPSRSRAAGNPPTPAQSSVSTPSNDHQPDHHRHQQAPLTAPRSNGHGPAVTPAYSDDDDVDERYETWQYEYTPVDRNLYPDASLVARLVNVLADDAHPLLRDLWDQQAAARPRAKDPLVPLLYDSAPVEFDTLPTPAPTAVKPLTGATFHLAPPIASTYVPSSNQGSACPYPRPTVHALFATAPIAAGAFVGALHGEVVPLATYRADPLSQYALLGVPKQGVRTLPVPWSVAIDQRRFGNELRFARCGCHPNAVVRVVRLGSSEPDSPVAWASQASAGRALLGQLVFAVFATVDIGRRDEIVLPWDWDDDHIVHALQGLMLAPPLPRGIVHDDLEPLARKMAIVATTLLGTNHCACDKKRDCALFWMCRAAGATAPMSKAAAAKREPFATILLNAMGAAKDDGAARGKARKAKKPDVGPLLGLERGWIKREPRVVEPAPPAPEHEPLPVLDVVVEPHREDEKENVDAMEVDQPTPVEPKSSLADLPPPPTPLASTSSLPTLAVTVIELPPPAEPTPSTASKRRQSTSRPAPPRIEDDVDSDGSDLTEPLSHRSDDEIAPASTKADESDDDAPPAPVRRRIPVPAKRTAKDVGPARKKPRTAVEDKDKNRKKKLDKGKGRARESSDEPPAAAVERKAVAPAAPEPPKEKKKKQIVVIKKVTETLVEKPVDLVALREKKERKEREREKDRKDREKAQREKDREEKRERERRREEEEDEQSDESSESEDDPPPPPPKKRGSKAKPPAAAPAPAPREPSPVVDPVEAARLEAMIFDGPAEVVVHKPASPPPPPPPPRKLTMEDYRRMRKNPDAAAQSADPASLESAVVAKADVPATVDVVMAEPVPDVPPVLEPAPEPIVIEVVKEPTPPPPPPPAPRARLSLAAYRQRQQEQAQKPSDAPNESLAMPAVSASELVASPLTTPSLAQPTPPPTTTSASDSAPVPSSFNSAAAEDVLKRLGDYFSSQAAPAPVAPAAPVPPPSGPLSYTRALRRPTPPRRPSPPPRRERSRTPPTPDPHSSRSPILPAFDIPLRAPASFIKPELRRTSGGGLGLDAELPLSTREYGRQPSVYTSSSFSLGKSDSGSPMLSISPSLFQQPLPAAFSPPARSPSLQPAPPPNAPTGPRASPTLRYDRPPGEIPTGPRASPNAGYSLGGSGRAYNRPLPDVGASSYAQPAPLTYGPGPIPATGASAVPLGPRGFGALANNAPRASWPPQGHTQGPTTPGFRGTPRGHFVPRGPSMRGGRGGGPPPGPVGPSSRGIMRGRGGGLQGDGGWGPSRGRGRGRG